MAGLRVLVAQEQAWIVEKAAVTVKRARFVSMNVAATRHPVLRQAGGGTEYSAPT